MEKWRARAERKNIVARNRLAGNRQTTRQIQKFAPLTLRKPSYLGGNVEQKRFALASQLSFILSHFSAI